MAKTTAATIKAKKELALKQDTSLCLDEQVAGFNPRKLPALKHQAITNFKTTQLGWVIKRK